MTQQPVKPQASRRNARSRRRLAWLRAAALGLAITTGGGAFTPIVASAAENDSEIDGRLAGYSGKKVAIEGSRTTLTFMLFMVLTIVGCVPLFKNSKRD